MNYAERTHGLAYGLGVDSTAVLVGWKQRGIRPDFILFADVGAEKDATYAYLPVIQEWLRENRFPPVTVVRYTPRRSPYTTIEGNMCMNATLPGSTFGRGSCTMKWKIDPQNKWTNNSDICRAAWARGSQIPMINSTFIIHNRKNTIPTKQATPNATM